MAPVPSGDDQGGVLEHAQVLHHPEAAEVGQRRAQLGEGLSVALEEAVEQQAALTVGEGAEHRFVEVVPGRVGRRCRRVVH